MMRKKVNVSYKIVYNDDLWYNSKKMIERLRPHELPAQPLRLDYGAVPLEPWTAVTPGDSENYLGASLERIDTKLNQAMTGAVMRGWVESPELANNLQKFLAVSLYDSQRRRIELNEKTDLKEVLHGDDPRMRRAKNGTATPVDLLELLVEYPALGSVELAKLSHPLDAVATVPMDTDVVDTLASKGGEMLETVPRYKMKRRDSSIPAGIVLRKQAVANLSTGQGLIQVIQRKSFLVRADNEVGTTDFLDRKIKNPDRFGELAQKIDGYWTHADLKWLQPTATSYYAKYVGVDKSGETLFSPADDV